MIDIEGKVTLLSQSQIQSLSVNRPYEVKSDHNGAGASTDFSKIANVQRSDFRKK